MALTPSGPNLKSNLILTKPKISIKKEKKTPSTLFKANKLRGGEGVLSAKRAKQEIAPKNFQS